MLSAVYKSIELSALTLIPKTT